MSQLIKTPKYERQKFLLAFLSSAGGRLTKIDFQKLLFLFHRENKSLYYDFIPYLYGCYSFQANADLSTLALNGWLEIGDKDIILKNEKVPEVSDNSKIKHFLSVHNSLRGKKLIRDVYLKYPFYTRNSTILDSIMSHEEIEKIKALIETPSQDTELVTIGYEGITFERYINRLIKNDIRVLCDVRNNALSRKFGFSKSTLSTVLPKIGIKYVHIPQLGIISSKRQNLEEVSDYKILFEQYENDLPQKEHYINELLNLFGEYGRIALTCFEKDPERCHRHVLAQYMAKKYDIPVADI
jgi:hypothetical protein